MAKGNKNKDKRGGLTQADTADKHVLYEAAVQCVESEIDFVEETFSTLRGREARLLREDFCGTANSSCEWVRRRSTNIAYSVDIDPDVQAWGKEHHIRKLDPQQQQRVNLVTADVMDSGVDSLDVVLAMNFSYWIFKTRELMTRYFRSVYDSLNDEGIFILDSFGGYEERAPKPIVRPEFALPLIVVIIELGPPLSLRYCDTTAATRHPGDTR